MNRRDAVLDVAAWEVARFEAQANEQPPKYPEGAEGAALVARPKYRLDAFAICLFKCRGRESNPHAPLGTQDFKPV
jgi:hypothetical protein